MVPLVPMFIPRYLDSAIEPSLLGQPYFLGLSPDSLKWLQDEQRQRDLL